MLASSGETDLEGAARREGMRVLVIVLGIDDGSESSGETDLEGVSRRGGVKVLVTVFGIDDGSVAGLCFDVKTVQ